MTPTISRQYQRCVGLLWRTCLHQIAPERTQNLRMQKDGGYQYQAYRQENP